MADVINANPTVLDASALPTRLDSGKAPDKRTELLAGLRALSFRAAPAAPPAQVPDLVADSDGADDLDSEDEDVIDSQEVFDLISSISDPEHPLTLGQLAVVNLPDIAVAHGASKGALSEVLIKITPTITHCSLATLIGLGIRVRLERALPPRFRIRILIKEGTHQSENQVNKQLNDKERVAAACENDQLLTVISQMLSSCK